MRDGTAGCKCLVLVRSLYMTDIKRLRDGRECAVAAETRTRRGGNIDVLAPFRYGLQRRASAGRLCLIKIHARNCITHSLETNIAARS